MSCLNDGGDVGLDAIEITAQQRSDVLNHVELAVPGSQGRLSLRYFGFG